MKKLTACLLACVLVILPAVMPYCFAYSEVYDGTVDQYSGHSGETSMYRYDFNVNLYNPCNSKTMDDDAVNIFRFEFSYAGKNGTAKTEKYVFDMSRNGNLNRNYAFLKKNFIRPDDDETDVDFSLWVPGVVSKLHIILNMDGGERLAFKVKKVSCAGVQINANEDYVSSAYNDSEADITFTMPKPVIDAEDEGGRTPTLNELKEMISGKTLTPVLRDQYGVVIDPSVFPVFLAGTETGINQSLSHSDEQSMYFYTLYLNVTNPVNRAEASAGCIEELQFVFTYTDENGYGKEKQYTLDLSGKGGYNSNYTYVNKLISDSDDGYQTAFQVWIPGLLKKVDFHLNMAGFERLSFSVDGIFVNGFRANINEDYVSSAVSGSDATVNCYIPAARVVPSGTEIRDGYGAAAGSRLTELYRANPDSYVYYR